ncbi:MAG: hypothetical protein V3S41_03515, partial [Spirochaetia bacterium]
MQFSGADIIVIAIVLITLVVYRQMDRNNRSLEKIKRYAGRVHDELEVHVQEKVTAIKDMGIEVEVHQKAAREVLKRVQGIESGLNARSEEIEHIGGRIHEYDEALAELVKMTARAEENIGRVRDESAYVDGVGKRIKESRAKIADIEHSIGGLVDRFALANGERIEETQTAAFEDADARVSSMSHEMAGFQERLNQYAEYIRGVEERAEGIDERTRTALEEISDTVVHRAKELSEGTRTELEEISESVIHRVEGIGERTRTELEDISDTVMHRVQEASIQGSEQLSELREQLELLESGYEKKLLLLAERGEEMETAALAKLREQIDAQGRAVNAELGDRLEGNKKVLVERVEALESGIRDSQAVLAERSQTLEAEREAVLQRIAVFSTDLKRQIDTAAEKIQTSVLGEIESRLGEYESQITYRFEKLDGVGNDVEQLEARLHDSMEKVSDRVTADFAEFAEEFTKSREGQGREIDLEMGRLREQMGELETGIVDLKNEAYENVSEKLQVF